jgi:hypothetical protein
MRGKKSSMIRAILLVTLAALACAGAALSSAKPSLRVQSRGAVVLGTHFRAGELVTVTLITGNGPRRARVRAVNGTFKVGFRVPGKGCGAAYSVRAQGASGTVAVLVFAEPPVCVPPPRD